MQLMVVSLYVGVLNVLCKCISSNLEYVDEMKMDVFVSSHSMEEQCHFTFPSVSHVQQREDQLYVWSLPLVELPFQATPTECTAVTLKQTESLELDSFNNYHKTDVVCACTKPSPPTRITCYRKLLRMLKFESPDFPVYRHFRRLYSKYMQDVEKFAGNVSGQCVKQRKRRTRKSRGSWSNTQIAEKLENCNLHSCVMWTEKYKPTTAGDLVGNGHSIDRLKTWLENWKCYSDDVQHRDKKGGCKRKGKSIFILYLYLFPQNLQHLRSLLRFTDLNFACICYFWLL